MNEHTNGNGYANGNGQPKQKSFDIVPPKTPEQVAREEVLATMPRLRRECSRDPRLKRCVGAKWLFQQISDLTFMHTFGGDGFGKIWISIKDLKRIFGHDEGTLALWRDKLIDTGWIWYRDQWPKSCWGITGVSRQPEFFPPNSEFITQVAKGDDDAGDRWQVASGVGEMPIPEQIPQTAGETPAANGKLPHSPLAGGQRLMGDSPAVNGKVTGQSAGERPAVNGKTPHTPQGDSPQSAGRSPGRPLAGGQHIRSLRGVKEAGSSQGGATPTPEKQFQDWLAEVRDLFPAKRQTLKRELQGKLARAQSDEARAEWRRRIKAIDDLMHGGPVTDIPQGNKHKPTTTATRMTESKMTPEQVLESARSALKFNCKILTEGQRAALKRVGELPKRFATA